MGADPYRHDRLEAATERVVVDIGVEPAENAAGAQRADALEAGRGGEAGPLREVLVRDPRILLQGCDQSPVSSIEALFRHRFRR